MSEIEIEVIYGVPGHGKTEKIILRLPNSASKTLIFGHSHEFLDELLKRIEKLGISVVRWKGMSKRCPLREEDELISDLIEGNMPNRWICALCEGKEKLDEYGYDECSYRQQFENLGETQVVIAPIEYALTQEIEKFEPVHIYADDCSIGIKPDLPSKKDVWRFFNELNSSGILENADFMEKNKEEISFNDFYTHIPLYVEEIEEEMRSAYLQIIESSENIREVGKNFIDPFVLEDWFRLSQIYGKDANFGLPYIHKLFELAKNGYNVHFSEALPEQKKNFIYDMLERYEYENGKAKIKFDFNEVKRDNVEQGKVIRVAPKKSRYAWFPRDSLDRESTLVNVSNRIQKLSMGEKSVGVITFKDAEEDMKMLLPDYMDFGKGTEEKDPEKSSSLHFGDVFGKNILKEKRKNFVVGTQNIGRDNMKKMFELYYPHKEMPEKIEQIKHEEGGYRYKHEKMETLRYVLEDYPQYQAIHRGRWAVRSEPTYVQGRVPEKIKQECDDFRHCYIEEAGDGSILLREFLDTDEYIKKELKEGQKPVKELVDGIIKISNNITSDWGAYNKIEEFLKKNEKAKKYSNPKGKGNVIVMFN